MEEGNYNGLVAVSYYYNYADKGFASIFNFVICALYRSNRVNGCWPLDVCVLACV